MANKYAFRTVVEHLIQYIKVNIQELAKKELENTTKKEKLDKAVTTYIVALLAGAKVNLITKWVIEHYIIKNIPVLTQAVYDLLKDKVKGITK